MVFVSASFWKQRSAAILKPVSSAATILIRKIGICLGQCHPNVCNELRSAATLPCRVEKQRRSCLGVRSQRCRCRRLMGGGLLAVVAWFVFGGPACSRLRICRPAGCCHGCSLARSTRQLSPRSWKVLRRLLIWCAIYIVCRFFFRWSKCVTISCADVFVFDKCPIGKVGCQCGLLTVCWRGLWAVCQLGLRSVGKVCLRGLSA